MTVRQFLDLTATTAIALLSVAALLTIGASPVTLAVCLPVLLLLPGYAFVSALYPEADDLGSIGRFGLSLAGSVTITGLAGFLANFTVGVYPLPVLVTVATVTVSLCVVAIGRRLTVAAEDRAGPLLFERLGRTVERYLRGTRSLRSTAPLEATSGSDVFLNLVVASAILVFAASVGFAALVPQGEGVTETYLATTSGENVTIVEDPAGLSEAQRSSVVAAIQNEEGKPMAYSVLIVAQDVSQSDGQLQVESESVVHETSGTLQPGDTWHVGVPTTDADRTVVRIHHGEASGDPDYRLVLEEP